MPYNAKSELTKNALADSLKKLMTQKPINKISIREITDDCGFKRLTFYYHFEDIYDLLKWTLRRELLVPLEKSGAFSTWQESGLYLLEYLKSNKTLALSVLDSVGRETLKNLISNDTYEFCMYFLRDIGKGLMFPTKITMPSVNFTAYRWQRSLPTGLKTALPKRRSS